MRRRVKGFTLVETLVAVMILVLVTLAIATGVGAGVGIHRDSRFASESELLASSLHYALGDFYRYAHVNENGTSFENPQYPGAGWQLQDVDGRVVMDSAGVSTPLLSEGAYTNLNVTAFTVNYTDGVFTGSYNIVSGWDAAIIKTITFAFRPLNG